MKMAGSCALQVRPVCVKSAEGAGPPLELDLRYRIDVDDGDGQLVRSVALADAMQVIQAHEPPATSSAGSGL